MQAKNKNSKRAGGKSPAPVRSRPRIKQDSVASIEAELLRRVRAEENLSRIELARRMKLAPSTAGIYVDRLIAAGFLLEERNGETEFGRPPKSLALNPDGGCFVGVDFEARNIMATAVDFSQKPIKKVHDTIIATDSVEDILSKIERAISSVVAREKRSILAIGLGVPGSIDPATGVALHYRHIPGWNNIALAERMQKKFGTPVFLENNIRSMALAELWFGEGRGAANFICIGVRSGVGAGIILDGHIYHGNDNLAGEIADWPCFSGNGKDLARLEDIASVRGIQTSVAGNTLSKFVLEDFANSALSGDKAALKILDDITRSLGQVLVQLNLAFNPEKIILAGALTIFGSAFLNRLKSRTEEFRNAPAPLIVNSTLGEFNGALGAAALAVHEWKPVPR